METIKVNKKELKNMKASTFKHGDVIKCGKYYIHIRYKNGNMKYKKPNMLSYVEDDNFKILGCTPGCGRPYFIDNFLNK